MASLNILGLLNLPQVLQTRYLTNLCAALISPQGDFKCRPRPISMAQFNFVFCHKSSIAILLGICGFYCLLKLLVYIYNK